MILSLKSLFLRMMIVCSLLVASSDLAWTASSAAKNNTAKKTDTQATVVDDVYSDTPAFDYKTVSSQLAEIEADIKKKQFTRQSLEEKSSFLTQQEIVIEFAVTGIE